MTASPPPPVDRQDLLDLASQLVSIKSVNPAYDPSSNERAVAELVQSLLARWKIPFETQPVAPGRENVIARLEGTGEGCVLFEAHMDTVSADGMEIDPFTPRCEGDRLYGRGACDTKGGLAAMLYAIKRIAEAGVRPASTVLLAATIDEEHGFQGVSRLVQRGVRADGAVVAEPTDLKLVIAHKGCLRWRLTVRGKAAHSSKPHLGVNAVVQMAHVIEAIQRDLLPGYAKNPHPLLGPATLSIGVIRGGTQVNMVPQQCWIEIDRRLLPGESRQTVWRELEQLFERLRSEDRTLDVVIEPPMLEDGPLETDPAAKIVRVAAEACRQVWHEARQIGVPYSTDASKLSRAGIPSIVLGPGSVDQAHSAVEFVSIDQLVAAAEIYARIMLNFSPTP